MPEPKDFILSSLQTLQSLEQSLPFPLPLVSQSLIDLTMGLPELPTTGKPPSPETLMPTAQAPGRITIRWEAS